MKIIRFLDDAGAVRFGTNWTADDAEILEGVDYNWIRSGRRASITKLLAPVDPRCIIGIGLNYRKHAEEGVGNGPFATPEYPVVFFKSPGAIQNPNDPIILPRYLPSDCVDYECELAIVIGKACKNATIETALDYVAGFTCANDVSARDWQIKKGGSQWSRGKTFDTFAPLGPCLVTPDDIDADSVEIRTVLNDETMQQWTTSDMIFSTREIIAFLSGSTTLLPGTVILTGTPHGVGMAQSPPRYLQAGDVVHIEIDGIGRLTNPVLEEEINHTPMIA
ncbi:MAG: fumarylacetoacetate hydrolase family protein [Rhodothermales bacterium]|nr:fumarylacetoacetate hydrolase family protein [Rhodothermales bacterium]